MKYEATVMVEYTFEVEAEDEQEAETLACENYSNYAYFADVYSVDIQELESDEDE